MLSFKIPTIPQSWVDGANVHLAKVGVELDSAFVGRHAETISWAVTLAILLVVASFFFPSAADKKRAAALKEAKRIQQRAAEAAERHQKSPVTFTLEELLAFDVSDFDRVREGMVVREGGLVVLFHGRAARGGAWRAGVSQVAVERMASVPGCVRVLLSRFVRPARAPLCARKLPNEPDRRGSQRAPPPPLLLHPRRAPTEPRSTSQ